MEQLKNILSNKASLWVLAVFLLFPTMEAMAKTSDVLAAEKRVLNITNSITRLLEQNKQQYRNSPTQLNAMIRREVLPFIDFNSMAKLTLGKHWRTANPQQRTRFINAYREMLVRSYAKTMLEYTGANVVAGRSVANKKPGYVLVRTVVKPKAGASITANYSVRKNSGDWKAYNVEIAGINLITNFRTNFTREASAKGLNALITRLEKTGK
ncbi:MAG: ABC transporter substrate-binding protein [Cocleimonas sp.]